MAMGQVQVGTPKKEPKTSKASIKENHSRVHPCFIIKDDKVTCKTADKQLVVAIWATCRLCKFKSLDCRVYGLKMKPRNCPLWTGCIKHVENIHYLLNTKDLEEALADPKAHWDSLEESKARKRGIETKY